jgi:hypothetical protein
VCLFFFLVFDDESAPIRQICRIGLGKNRIFLYFFISLIIIINQSNQSEDAAIDLISFMYALQKAQNMVPRKTEMTIATSSPTVLSFLAVC